MSGRPHPLHAAISLFTVIPVPPVALDRSAARSAIWALPWVGGLVGLVAALVAGGAQALGGGPLLAALLGLGVLALSTGGLHLDGLADTADGLASRRPAVEALAIMKRSDIGPMGVASLVFVLGVDAAALASPRVAAAGPLALAAALVAGPMIGRLLAVAGTTPGHPPAHAGGFAALFAGVSSPRAVAVDAVAVLAVCVGLGAVARGGPGALAFGLAATAAWLVGWGWRRHLVRRLGGLTGDTWGSLIELGQLIAWVVLAVTL